MRYVCGNGVALLSLLVGVIACGTGPHLDTTGMEREFPNGQNPVGLLEARFAKQPDGQQFGQQIGYEYSAHHYCTAFLRTDGLILTESDCLFDSKNKRMVDTQNMRVYFRRPKDERTQEVAIKRVVKSTKAFDQNWVVLEPNDRFNLVAKFGGLRMESHLTMLAGDKPASAPKLLEEPGKEAEAPTIERIQHEFQALEDAGFRAAPRVVNLGKNAAVEARLIAVNPPDSSGLARMTRGAGAVQAGDQIESVVKALAAELRRQNGKLTTAEAEARARARVNKDPATELATTGRVSVRVLERQEFGSHGGVVVRNGAVIAIMPRSLSKTPNRTENGLRAGGLPF